MVLTILFILLLTVHLASMNLASVGPLFSVWLRLRAGSERWDGRIGRSLAWLSLNAYLIGIATGGLALFLSPTEGLFPALHRFPNKAYGYAALELLFSGICLFLFARFWPKSRKWRGAHSLLPLLSATNLLYHFPSFMAVIGLLASDPTWSSQQMIDRPALLALMQQGEVLSLTIHFILGSVALSACGLLWLLSKQEDATASQHGRRTIRITAGSALVTTLLQLPIGIWVLVSLPTGARNALLGESLIASFAFLVSMLLVFMLLQRLAILVLGEIEQRPLRQVAWLLLLVVLLMTASLQLSRIESPLNKTKATRASTMTS